MKTKEFKVVDVDDILEDCPHASQCFNEADLSVSFGDACWTLMAQDIFLRCLGDAGLDLISDDEINAEQTPLDFEMKTIYDRLDKLGDSTYIALQG